MAKKQRKAKALAPFKSGAAKKPAADKPASAKGGYRKRMEKAEL